MDDNVRSKHWSLGSTLTGLMSLRKPLGTSEESSGFLWMKLSRKRHVHSHEKIFGNKNIK